MKILKNILCVVALSLLLVACGNKEEKQAREQLQSVIEQISFPQKVDSTTTLVGMTFNDGILTSRIEIPATRLAKIDTDSLKAYQLKQLSSNLNSIKLKDLALKGKVSLRYVYFSGTDSVGFEITPKEMVP